jgi:hypothetical protein
LTAAARLELAAAETLSRRVTFLKRISAPAWGLLQYLKAVEKLNRWLRVSVRFLQAKYRRAASTVKRWLGELRAAGYLQSHRHGRKCREYTLSIPQNDTSEQLHLFTELSKSESPTEIQNHPDDVAGVFEVARKSAGFERLSEGDRRYVRGLAASGVSAASIRAGILVGRARRMIADEKRGGGPVRSLRYFAGPIADAFEPGYVEHVAGWLERKRA